MAPPMTTKPDACSKEPGYFVSRLARLVNGPRAIRRISPGCLPSSPARKSTARWPVGRVDGLGSLLVSPLAPWTGNEYPYWPRIGRALPRDTGISVRPAYSNKAKAFRVPRARGTLPPTVVRPSTWNDEDLRAIKMAMASSTPGSVSIITFLTGSFVKQSPDITGWSWRRRTGFQVKYARTGIPWLYLTCPC